MDDATRAPCRARFSSGRPLATSSSASPPFLWAQSGPRRGICPEELGSAVLHGPQSCRCGMQAQRAPKEWVSLVFPRPCSLAPRRPVVGALQRGLEAAAGASRDGGPSLRSSPHAFLSLLLWHLHHVFRLAAPPPICCPRVVSCRVFPPPPPRLLWVRLGSASGRSRQRPPSGLTEPRCVRDPRQVSVGLGRP